MKTYIGTFLVAFATLALEVTLTRLLSVIAWYHLAFFAVSVAMLGMTAGAVTVYLKPAWFSEEKLNDSIAKACLGYAVIIPCALLILCHTPIGTEVTSKNFLMLIVLTIGASLPFYFSGIAITAVLTKSNLPIGKLYSSDLAGASLGCLFVLGGLEIFDAPTLILLCGSVAVLASFSFAWPVSRFKLRRIAGLLLVFILLLVTINSLSSYGISGIRPTYVKGRFDNPGLHELEEWNSYSRVVVYQKVEAEPQYWGPSPVAPKTKNEQYHMDIDGDASTYLRKFTSLDDISHLYFDVTNMAYYIRPKGGACIIGVGAGRDVQSAILFGQERILGIELNPIFIDLLQNRFREFAGIADYEGVELIVDEARTYLSRSEEKFSVIQMSLVDTWAATGAGAFSLSENTLYTLEAWQNFFAHLKDDGIFTVSRWYNPEDVTETGRIVSLATATLLESGVTEPSAHIAMIASDNLATLLLSKQPFSPQDILTLHQVSSDLEFTPLILPEVTLDHELLRSIVYSTSPEELDQAIEGQPLNFEPPTDDNPYFFNMLRLSHLDIISWSEPGVLGGNTIATIILLGLILSLLLVSVATIVIPLLLRKRIRREGNILWSGAAYFSLIGAGFMFVEISLIQRLSVFLGHPIYALGILLFTIIASAGAGSFLSERLPLTRSPWVYVYPVAIAIAIVIIRFLIPSLGSNMMSSPLMVKILVSILVISPLGILMGVCFPIGMRLVRTIRAAETPWYWALNGIFGVLCSALTVFISIYFGIATSLYVAAICYLMLLLCLPRMRRASEISKIAL
jgi:hypothetical protein